MPKRNKLVKRLRRKRSIRKKINGTASRPRLSVFRSSAHMYAQVIDDVNGATLASASTLCEDIKGGADGKKKSELAAEVGKLVAARCLEKNIETVIFDRNGFIYHGRIKAVAEGAREGGLKF